MSDEIGKILERYRMTYNYALEMRNPEGLPKALDTAKTDILALLEKQDIKSRIDELERLNVQFPTARHDPKNMLKVEGYNLARAECSRRIKKRIDSLSQSPVEGKDI